MRNAAPQAELYLWKEVRPINVSTGLLTVNLAPRIFKYIELNDFKPNKYERLRSAWHLLKRTDMLGWNLSKYNAIKRDSMN